MKPRIREAVVVEGRYDRNALLQAVDAAVVETAGFGVFSDAEKLALIRRLAEERGVVLLTDSDGAGSVIRGHLLGMLPKDSVKQAYIPEVRGKERRKRAPSKAGLIGVEGMPPETILLALRRAGATFLDGEDAAREQKDDLTRVDMIAAGLSGSADASARRAALCRELDLPEKLGGPALFSVLRVLLTREELFELSDKISRKG